MAGVKWEGQVFGQNKKVVRSGYMYLDNGRTKFDTPVIWLTTERFVCRWDSKHIWVGQFGDSHLLSSCIVCRETWGSEEMLRVARASNPLCVEEYVPPIVVRDAFHDPTNALNDPTDDDPTSFDNNEPAAVPIGAPAQVSMGGPLPATASPAKKQSAWPSHDSSYLSAYDIHGCWCNLSPFGMGLVRKEATSHDSYTTRGVCCCFYIVPCPVHEKRRRRGERVFQKEGSDEEGGATEYTDHRCSFTGCILSLKILDLSHHSRSVCLPSCGKE
eukprot:TRINITY_DN123794_c0_g1_i1.p1 TRINITY_DN123794_c0_g1~~TRINITY_DN123794_c0_g1_i1.p1  ORF type:complete len:272 (+),score=2.35 TRINITY_DN123794_c0_g1_i1:484-1299(+)